MMTSAPTTVVVRHSANQGVVAGIIACLLAVLGIFFSGLIFVPLAAICSMLALIRGIVGKSAAGIGCAILAGVLSVWGFVVSPSLWVLAGAGLLAAHAPSHPVSVGTHSFAEASIPAIAPRPNPSPGENPPPRPPISRAAVDALKRQAAAQADAAMTECRNKRLAGEIKTYAGSAECSNPRIIAAYWHIDYRYMDLIFDWTRKRIEVAKKEDGGRLTEAQASAQLSQFLVELRDREQQRDLAPIPCSSGCDPNSVGHRE